MSRRTSNVRRRPQGPGPDRSAPSRGASSSRSGAAADAADSPSRRLTDADLAVRPSRPFVQNLAIVVGAFAGATLIAELLGAANLGTALSFGQIAFAIALVYVLVRR